MPARILVPLDGSAFSEQALPHAFDIARRSGAELHLVRVHTLPALDWMAGGMTSAAVRIDDDLREADAAYLERVAEYAAMHIGGPVRTALLAGVIASALEMYVKSRHIDLVVMTTHGRTGLSRAWIGSVADALVRSINVPMLLLRPRADDAVTDAAPFAIDHILIPIDESGYSTSILSPALELGSLTRARFTLVQIVAPPIALPAADAVALPLQFARAVELRVEASTRLEELARRLRAEGHEVDTVIVIHGQAAQGLLEQAAGLKADVIAMSTHGRHGFARFALGSVTDKVVRGTSVPLLLWKPPAGDKAGTPEPGLATCEMNHDRPEEEAGTGLAAAHSRS